MLVIYLKFCRIYNYAVYLFEKLKNIIKLIKEFLEIITYFKVILIRTINERYF